MNIFKKNPTQNDITIISDIISDNDGSSFKLHAQTAPWTRSDRADGSKGANKDAR